MPFNPAPPALLGAAYAATSTTATLTIADFSELTSAEVNATTGDSRKILFALLSKVAADFSALSAADRPAKMRINNNSSSPNASGQFVRTFSISFDVAIGTQDVASEA